MELLFTSERSSFCFFLCTMCHNSHSDLDSYRSNYVINGVIKSKQPDAVHLTYATGLTILTQLMPLVSLFSYVGAYSCPQMSLFIHHISLQHLTPTHQIGQFWILNRSIRNGWPSNGRKKLWAKSEQELQLLPLWPLNWEPGHGQEWWEGGGRSSGSLHQLGHTKVKSAQTQ